MSIIIKNIIHEKLGHNHEIEDYFLHHVPENILKIAHLKYLEWYSLVFNNDFDVSMKVELQSCRDVILDTIGEVYPIVDKVIYYILTREYQVKSLGRVEYNFPLYMARDYNRYIIYDFVREKNNKRRVNKVRLNMECNICREDKSMFKICYECHNPVGCEDCFIYISKCPLCRKIW